MVIIKNQTHWLYILSVVFFFVFTSGETLFLQHERLLKESAVLESSIIHKPVPEPVSEPVTLPTEIDQNFLMQVNKCFIPAAAVYGYTLRVTSGFRSLTEQDQLFDQGRTKNGHIVTWATAGKSLHNYGLAVDVVDRRWGYDINWKKLEKIGVFCGLEQVDDAHFEHRGGLATDQFEAGIRPSPLTLPCALMDERAKVNQPLTVKDLKDCGASNF